MKIFILSSGEYGFRIVNNLAKHGLSSSMVGLEEFSDDIPEFIEDFSDYVPVNLPECDLIISVGLFGDINLIVSEIASKTGAKAIIMPIHHPRQIPNALKEEIKNSLKNTTIVFPKPFCALSAVDDPYIQEFIKKFGKPELNIEADTFIKHVHVERGAPCGSTWYVAEELIGVGVDDAELEAGNKFHNYPCMASMNKDPLCGDTVMHLAGYKTKEAVKRALGFTFKAAVVDKEICQGGEDCAHLCLKVCPNVLCGDNTISIDNNGKAIIDPASCGLCEKCIFECPYGAIEIFNEKIACIK